MRGLRSRLEPVTLARFVAAHWTEAGAYAAAVFACVTFASRAVDRHRSFESNAYDFGFFDQIVWNTSHGRWFASSFTPYNFLGQHFQPVLLIFALAYRLGAGIESLLITQTIFVAAAAIPLFYAVRRATSSGVAGLAMSAGFLLSASLHDALDFDVHPEMMGFFFVFLAAFYLVSERPRATIVALLPLLLLKEDMPLILGAFSVLLFARGFRRPAAGLFAVATVWAIAVVLVTMPLIRGGSGDLTQRYGYLTQGSTALSILPDALSRGAGQLWGDPLEAIVNLGASTGFAGILSPIALLVAAPAFLLAALSDHPQQSQLELHYAMAPLALAWVAAILGTGRLAHERGGTSARPAQSRWVVAVALFVLACSGATFLRSSPYSPRAYHREPSAEHRAVLQRALSVIPATVTVSAQGTLLPHLSHREEIFEFPDLGHAAYVIIDPSLPKTGQARDAGYETQIASLPSKGYEPIFDVDGVRVFRRTP